MQEDNSGSTTKDRKERKRLVGIKCHWFDKNKELQKSRFHSKELIPLYMAERGCDAVNDWITDDKKDKYWIKEGEEVVHRDNLEKKMWVEELLYEPIK